MLFPIMKIVFKKCIIDVNKYSAEKRYKALFSYFSTSFNPLIYIICNSYYFITTKMEMEEKKVWFLKNFNTF